MSHANEPICVGSRFFFLACLVNSMCLLTLPQFGVSICKDLKQLGTHVVLSFMF